jgi:hypothetical protein
MRANWWNLWQKVKETPQSSQEVLKKKRALVKPNGLAKAFNFNLFFPSS